MSSPTRGARALSFRVMAPLFLILASDAIGVGVILPLLPFYSRSYGATPFIIGAVIASYSLGQFFAAPVLGVQSDRFGRKRPCSWRVRSGHSSVSSFSPARRILRPSSSLPWSFPGAAAARWIARARKPRRGTCAADPSCELEQRRPSVATRRGDGHQRRVDGSLQRRRSVARRRCHRSTMVFRLGHRHGTPCRISGNCISCSIMHFSFASRRGQHVRRSNDIPNN